MLHLTININGKLYERKVPQSWGETTLNQFYKLRNIDDNFKFSEDVAIMTGLDKSIFLDSDNIEFDAKIYPVLEWMENKFDAHTYPVPDFVEVNGKKIARPKGIALGTFGQKLELQNLLTNAEKTAKDEIDCFAHALAIYLQPGYTGSKFDSDKAKELIPHILEMPLSQSWPLASFFLSNYGTYLKRNQSNFRILIHRKRFSQELTSLRSSESFQQLSVWRRLIVYLLSKFLSWNILPYSLRSQWMPKKPALNGTYTIK